MAYGNRTSPHWHSWLLLGMLAGCALLVAQRGAAQALLPESLTQEVVTLLPVLPVCPGITNNVRWYNRHACFNAVACNDSIVENPPGTFTFKLDRDDPESNVSNMRAEISENRRDAVRARRYIFQIRLPEDWGVDVPSARDSIAQWHGTPDRNADGTLAEPFRVPPLALVVAADQLQLWGYYDPEKFSDYGIPFGLNGSAIVWQMPIDNLRGRWVTFDLTAFWSLDAAGHLELKVDDQVVYVRNGPNVYNDDQFVPYFNVGTYKFSWQPGNPSAGPSILQNRTFQAKGITIY